MAQYTNQLQIPLALAVFLASDDYDYETGVISATSLIKPVRQLILPKRMKPEEIVIDISSLVSSRMGSSIHSGIEKAWNDPVPALKALGYPKKVWGNILINPTKELLAHNPNAIPVYMEQRAYKEILGFKVSGKYDFVAEGKVQDFKSTSVYTYMNQTNVEKYILQGSIYRWLNPDIITEDTMMIHYIFTDWSKASALQNKDYPQSRVLTQRLKLLSVQETEQYILNKLTEYKHHLNSPETEIPHCSEEDLWRKDSVWKYYRDPSKMTGRSTKNFDNRHDAYIRLAEDGNVGIVVEVRGQVNACKYCAAFNICTQKDEYLKSGDLVLN